MQNIIKGWLLSAIGFAIIVFDIAYFFGYKPPFMPSEGIFVAKAWELLIAFGIGLILMLVPPTVLEKKANDIVDKIDIIITKKTKDE